MLVSQEQLARVFRTLDEATIRGRLLSDELTADARAVAVAELARRARAGRHAPEPVDIRPEPAAAPPPGVLPGKGVIRVVLRLYLVLVALGVVIMLLDPPWAVHRQGTWGGMIGTLAGFAVGLPWTYLFIRVAAQGTAWTVATCLAGIAANLAFFSWYLKRS